MMWRRASREAARGKHQKNKKLQIGWGNWTSSELFLKKTLKLNFDAWRGGGEAAASCRCFLQNAVGGGGTNRRKAALKNFLKGNGRTAKTEKK